MLRLPVFIDEGVMSVFLSVKEEKEVQFLNVALKFPMSPLILIGSDTSGR